MTASAPHDTPYRALGEALQREMGAGRVRLAELRTRRQEIEAALKAARAAEDAARYSLEALEAIAREAGELYAGRPEREVAEDGLTRLAGAELRDMIARIALQHRAVGQAVHWSEWHGWLRDAGFEAAGKNPAATFQTQLARSALVSRSAHDGVYVLDLAQFIRQRDRLHTLHQQLAQLPPPDQLALLGDVRAQRRELQNQIARVERAVEEIWRVLAQERPPVWPAGVELVPERTVAAWLEDTDPTR